MEKDNTYRKLEKDFASIRDERGTQANTANRIGSAFLSLLSYIGNAAFLRKDVPDTAEQIVTFLKGIIAKAVSYFHGIDNIGDIKNNGDITNTGNISNKGDITNKGNIMTNNLTVTGKATFFELEIQKAKAAGGMSVNSAGTFHIDAVEEMPDGFVCYQRAEKDGVTLLQTCEPKDQMMCSNGMNILKGGKGNHYYWRLATKAPKKVVMHTIDGKEEKCLKLVLSKTDHSKNTVDIPKVGDDLVQIGNRDNKERQSVIMTCAYNSFDGELKAPYWVQYSGVNDYKLSTHKRTWFAANGSQVTGNFKVQSDNGGLESIEDYMKSLASENSSVLYKLVMSSSQFNVKADGSFTPQFIYINAYKVQGENLTPLSPSENVKVYVSKGENELGIKGYLSTMGRWNLWVEKEDLDDVLNVDLYVNGKLADKQKIHVVRDGQDGRNGRDGQKGKDGINGENGTDGKDGKDAVSYNLIPMQEAAVAYKADSGKKLVRLFLAYKIQKKVGEVTRELALGEEGIKLSVTGITETFKSIGGAYVLDKKDVEYKETNIDTYIVTLKKGSDIVDQRIVPITFKPKVVFDIDTKNGEIRSDITNVKGDVNSFRATIKKTKATVGNLQKEFTQLQMTSKEISLTVNNGTRPNLLWGSDLDLSGVQDKIKLAYHNGDVIQLNTAEKENLQRQLDATPTNDTAKRNDLQKKIDICNDEITAARNKISECRAAIHKHLGVGLNSTKIDSREWFEYLKGRGISGADALKFKAMKGTAEFTGLFWEVLSGGTRNLKLKPNTEYTLSAWVRTEFDKNAQGYSNFVFEAFKARKEDLGERVGRLSFKKTDSWFEPINEWTRVSATFTTEELLYGSVAMWVNGTKPATLYICRPKLEEGNTATPWCEYDGTTEALLGSGLDIKGRKYIATADNFKVQNNKGEQTFFVDEKGRINNGMLVSKLRLTEPTIITNENYKEFCYNGKVNGHDELFLDLLKCGTLLVLMDVTKQLYLDLPSFKRFEIYNDNTLAEKAKAQYEKMRYIGNTIILYNINSQSVFVSGTLKQKRMAGVKDMNHLDEFGFYTEERLPCRGSELACFECKFGITRPEGNQVWYNRQSGVYWEFCYVTIS